MHRGSSWASGYETFPVQLCPAKVNTLNINGSKGLRDSKLLRPTGTLAKSQHPHSKTLTLICGRVRSCKVSGLSYCESAHCLRSPCRLFCVLILHIVLILKTEMTGEVVKKNNDRNREKVHKNLIYM